MSENEVRKMKVFITVLNHPHSKQIVEYIKEIDVTRVPLQQLQNPEWWKRLLFSETKVLDKFAIEYNLSQLRQLSEYLSKGQIPQIHISKEPLVDRQYILIREYPFEKNQELYITFIF